MFSLPPLPRWDAAHPILVHFPLGLLLVAPAMIVLAMIARKKSAGLLVASWVMVALGTVSLFVALMSGEAGEDAAEGVPGASTILEHHEDLAEAARNAFAVLAVLFTAWTVVAVRTIERWPRRVFVIGCSVYLVLHAAASLILVNAAHEGGRLVHELGVRAPMPQGTAADPAATRRTEHQERDDE